MYVYKANHELSNSKLQRLTQEIQFDMNNKNTVTF